MPSLIRTGARLMSGSRRAATLASLLLVCPLVSACGAEPVHSLPPSVAAGLRQSIATTNVTRVEVFKVTAPNLRSATKRLSELRNAARNQGNLTPEAEALLRRAAIAQTAGAEIRRVVLDANLSALGMPGLAKRIAESSNEGGDAFVTTRLSDAAQEILPDITCQVAWSYMTPREQDNAYAHGETRTFENVVKEASAEAVADYVAKVVLRDISASALYAFQWARYSGGLVEKANDLVGPSAGETITLPNGATYTRAAYYYARLCLRPPGH